MKAGQTYTAVDEAYRRAPIAQSMSIIQSAHPVACLFHVAFKGVGILS